LKVLGYPINLGVAKKISLEVLIRAFLTLVGASWKIPSEKAERGKIRHLHPLFLFLECLKKYKF
jgi:hypothetical protein